MRMDFRDITGQTLPCISTDKHENRWTRMYRLSKQDCIDSLLVLGICVVSFKILKRLP